MPRKKLIIVASDKMDSNKKQERNEDGLLRMSAKARDNMGYKDEVEVYPNTKDISKRLNGAMMLTIFQAFSSDIKRLRKEGATEEELQRTAFVTNRTFQRIVGRNTKNSNNIWITDEIEDTVIGADPEFLLFSSDGSIVSARNILGHAGPIGSDGAMAELRPKPAITPRGLVDNIKALLSDEDLTRPISPYSWVGGCYFKDSHRDYPIGGHIHIGNPSKIANMCKEDRRTFFVAFNKILDEMLAIPMGKYGYFGECRLCAGRLEYRTLSGNWLIHPKLSILVLGTAKALIDEVYKLVSDNGFSRGYIVSEHLNGHVSYSNLKTGTESLNKSRCWRPDFNLWKDIALTRDMGCTMSSEEVAGILNRSSIKDVTPKRIQGWYSKMRTLSTYGAYSKHIDGLYEVLKSKPVVFEKINKELKTNWLNGGKFI
jgi:hypothetical protein